MESKSNGDTSISSSTKDDPSTSSDCSVLDGSGIMGNGGSSSTQPQQLSPTAAQASPAQVGGARRMRLFDVLCPNFRYDGAEKPKWDFMLLNEIDRLLDGDEAATVEVLQRETIHSQVERGDRVRPANLNRSGCSDG
ncbi:hypothetical protein OC844_006977 [Tilletia horrida]|nr:hypothetical protein OC844_006977 [Tilletia horrida]